MWTLRQNSSITTGNSRTAIGRAPAAWNVEVDGVAASRTGELYHRAIIASNGVSPVWKDVVTRRDTGTPSTTGHFWYAATPLSPVHDSDGNLTNDGRWSYVWSAENRLIQMESTPQAVTAGHPYTKVVNAYDWQGRRIAKHVWQGGTAASPVFASSTRWLYNGWNEIVEFSASSSTATTLTREKTFTWGLDLSGSLQGAGGVGGLLVQTTVASGVKEAASYDGNGNIVAWTKSTASAPTAQREYDAFGNTVVSEGNWPSSFGFSTKRQDAETGLYYYRYRFYDPGMGRWVSKDPIEEEGGVNLYGFVGNDGVNRWDVLGLRWEMGSWERTQAVRDKVKSQLDVLAQEIVSEGKNAGVPLSCKTTSQNTQVSVEFKKKSDVAFASMYFTGFFALGGVSVNLVGSGEYSYDCCKRKPIAYHVDIDASFRDDFDELINIWEPGWGDTGITFVGSWVEKYDGSF